MRSSIWYRKESKGTSLHLTPPFYSFFFFLVVIISGFMKNVFIPVAFVLFFAGGALAQGNAWDFLRPITDFAVSVDLPVKFVVFLLALAIFVISLLAYTKSRSKRLLLVSVAFFLFSLKWLVKLIDIFYSPGTFLSDSSENIFELGIMLSLLIALFYRKSWGKFFEN